jgi:leucyl-tRNA synthetase
MLSDSPPDRDVIWTEEGVQAAHRFVQRVWRLVAKAGDKLPKPGTPFDSADAAAVRALRTATHQTLQDNTIQDAIDDPAGKYTKNPGYGAATREALEILVQTIAPMMPHLAEECWAALGHSNLVAEAPWPTLEPSLLVEETITLPVQVNGKKRADVMVARDANEPQVQAAVLALEPIQRALEGRTPKRIIVVPQRIVNVVV